MKPTIIFAGSGEFGRSALSVLSEHFEIKLVITQPARKAGKGGKLQETPVAILSKSLNLPLTTPDTADQLFSDFSSIKTDLVVVADYGQIIPQTILDVFPTSILNIHPSLLPKYRGPSPLQAALLNGDDKTGVTVMVMDSKMDHGPILAQEEYILTGTENTPQLSEILSVNGAKLLKQVAHEYLNGQLLPTPQNHTEATYCKLIKKDQGLILNTDTTTSIDQKYRALQPWPGIYLQQVVNNRPMKIKILTLGENIPSFDNKPSGELVTLNDKLYLRLSDGCVEVKILQPEGKNAMSSAAFISGYRLSAD